MKGLLVKDFRLLTVNREFIILTLILGVGMLIFASGRQLFPLMFVMFVAAIVGAGTINDDEADNGNAFLFTMPFSVREYVAEKYLYFSCSFIWALEWRHLVKSAPLFSSSITFSFTLVMIAMLRTT